MDHTSAFIHIYRDPEEVAAQAAGWLHHLISASTGRFSICLSGGNTLRLLYEKLAQPPYVKRLPWQRVHWFWGDERFVPPDHPESNYGMARRAFLHAVPAPAENVHPVKTRLATPAAAAADYQHTLQRFYEGTRFTSSRALFDIVLLGVGGDGHTASLFPGAPALDEAWRWATPVIGFRDEARVTLTLPALQSSGHIAFLACGAKKRKIVSDILSGSNLPAARVRSAGTIHWFLDEAAAVR
jgi:6-phosphogluconolactonase